MIKRFYGVVVSTRDSNSLDQSSNLCRSYFFKENN
jgi:hypothetical protein